MKVTFKILVVALGLFISDLSFGSTGTTFEAEVTGSKSFRLEIKQSPKGAQIKLKDQYGYTLYSRNIIDSEDYHKVINVSKLPKGTYQLELEYPTVIRIIPLEIESNRIILGESTPLEIFKPVIRQAGSTVSISMLNIQRIPIDIRIYDDRDKLVFKDKLTNDLVLGKQYSFSNMKHGDYTINLSFDNNRVISQTVKM